MIVATSAAPHVSRLSVVHLYVRDLPRSLVFCDPDDDWASLLQPPRSG